MNQSRQLKRKDRRGERGSVLPLAVISMLALVLSTGLAIDVSHLYAAKAELQNAADAAALAAASQLSSTSGGIRSAVAEATKTINKYDFSTSNNVTLSAADVTFATNLNGAYVSQATAEVNATTMRFVKVTLSPKPVGLSLAGLAMSNPQNLTATATAGTSVGLTMNKFYTAYTFVDSSAAPMVAGQTYTLGSKNWNDSSPASYRVLAGPDGDLILTGQIHAYGYIGTSYNIAKLVSSEMCRYAKIGMNTRFGDYTVHPQANPTDEPPDTITQENITYAQYRDMQGNNVIQASNGMKNRRIITVPVGPNTAYNTSTPSVNADRLAAFFIKSKVGVDCNLSVEYIGAPIVVPEGTYQPGLSSMGGLGIPVLYK